MLRNLFLLVLLCYSYVGVAGYLHSGSFIQRINEGMDNTLLHESISNLDRVTFSAEIQNVMSINHPNIYGNTPLHYALIKYIDAKNAQESEYNEGRIVDCIYMCLRLIQVGADLNLQNNENISPLMLVDSLDDGDPLLFFIM